jgi:catechol 2,3-dioxygenase-like lactoylglutathione lyase family enzyme
MPDAGGRPTTAKCILTAWLGLCILFFTDVAQAQAIKIERLAVTVSDLGQTEAFYRDGLGFETLARRSFRAPEAMDTLTMALGREQVEFIRYVKPGRVYPAASRSSDLWFQHFAIVVANMDAAYARLRRVHFRPISKDGPQTLPEEDGRVRAFKFRDPDGHPLELLYFPRGQGRKIWNSTRHRSVDLGIDHTAISVSNTAASLAFYVGLLGMKVAYRSVNHGAAQDRLDDIRDVKVRITGLRPKSPSGPGVELLDYRSAPRSRPAPSDPRNSDLWRVQVVMRVAGLDRLVAKLHRHRVHFVSSGVLSLAPGRRVVEIADPDGHDLVLEEQGHG